MGNLKTINAGEAPQADRVTDLDCSEFPQACKNMRSGAKHYEEPIRLTPPDGSAFDGPRLQLTLTNLVGKRAMFTVHQQGSDCRIVGDVKSVLYRDKEGADGPAHIILEPRAAGTARVNQATTCVGLEKTDLLVVHKDLSTTNAPADVPITPSLSGKLKAIDRLPDDVNGYLQWMDRAQVEYGGAKPNRRPPLPDVRPNPDHRTAPSEGSYPDVFRYDPSRPETMSPNLAAQLKKIPI